MPVERRWRYLLVGAAERAGRERARRTIRADLGPDARVEVRAAVEVASPGFVLFESMLGLLTWNSKA